MVGRILKSHKYKDDNDTAKIKSLSHCLQINSQRMSLGKDACAVMEIYQSYYLSINLVNSIYIYF